MRCKPGDNLFEIETDKVSMEVPATEAGVLSEIRVSEGEVAPVGAVVAVIGDAGRRHGRTSAAKAETPKTAAAPVAAPPASARALPLPKRRSSRSSSIRSSRCARRSAILDRRGCLAASR